MRRADGLGDFLTGVEGGLEIDWAEMPTYNTVMSLAAGAGLILVVALGRRLLRGDAVEPEGWALAFGVLGVLLSTTGLHMTLTWPLAPGGFAFDNIIFGEPSLVFGVLMLAAAYYLWRRGDRLTAAADPGALAARLAGPVSVLVFGMGLGSFAIAASGWAFTLFVAPPQEPISGAFADTPLLEASFISGLYVLVGIGAVLFPFALRTRATALTTAVGVAWAVSGVVFLLFGALNYYTHIGLIVNTM
ncbi:DUF981 family protein [Thermobifida halotolerans]|uniref:DUF981 family protein n=1 Tax=Thermobifida halotolerans TaxID=483545 RepID=A0A399G044_9ACTN|nr:DUF981 family protein [Thermobifida halotolerans]UOE18126.1 DUF981 family protein [Thermobifida halotolerans]